MLQNDKSVCFESVNDEDESEGVLETNLHEGDSYPSNKNNSQHSQDPFGVDDLLAKETQKETCCVKDDTVFPPGFTSLNADTHAPNQTY